MKKQEYKKRINNNKRYHAHLAEDEYEEEGPPRNQAREEDAEEYVLFSALSRSITPREETSRSLNLLEESKEEGKIIPRKTTLAFNVFIVIR